MRRMILTTTCLSLLAMPALAQDEADFLPVIDLSEVVSPTAPRAADSSVELRYGGYTGVQYRSNIYREAGGETDDFIGIFAPGFAVRSDLDRHEFTIKGDIEAGHYFSENDNDYIDGDLRADGRYDLAEDEHISGYARLRYDHVEVGGFSTDAITSSNRAEEPTPYRFGEIGTEYQSPLGDMLLGRVGAGANTYNYDNVDQLSGGRIIQDDRDRNEYMAHALLGYRAAPGLLPYVAIEGNQRDYHEKIDASAIYERDSQGAGIFAGLELNEKNVDDTWALARIGLLHQGYDNAFLPDVDTWGMDIDASHRLSEVTRLRFDASRSIEENTFLGASSALQTRARLSAYHDLSDVWQVDGALRYTLNDFQINPASGRAAREDDIYEASVGTTYFINGPFYLRGEYGYAERDSDEPLAQYTDNSVIVSVGLKY